MQRLARTPHVHEAGDSASMRRMLAVHHLALRTRDVDRLLAFYAAWFTLEIVRDARPHSVWLGLAHDAVLMIELAPPEEPLILRGSLELTAFAIAIEQRPSLRARLLAAGLLEAETEHTLYFRDPDGRRVALSSYPLGPSIATS